MANKRWIGGAQARRYQGTIRPVGFGEGDLFRLKINRKTLEVPGGSVEDMVSGCVDFLQQTNEPEWRELEVISPLEEDDDPKVLIVAGPEDGRPVTITTQTVNADPFAVSLLPSFRVTVTTVQQGFAGQNEQVRVVLSAETSGGTFTLTYGGYTTAAIAYNASAAELELAFEALTSVGEGNGTVTGNAGDWTIEFTGTLAYTNVGPVTGDGANLTGGVGASVVTLTDGSPSANPKFRLHPPAYGWFYLYGTLPLPYGIGTTGVDEGLAGDWYARPHTTTPSHALPCWLPYTCTAEDIETHLADCVSLSYSATDCNVSADPDHPGDFILEWVGPRFLGKAMWMSLRMSDWAGSGALLDPSVPPQTPVTVITPGTATQNEVQRLTYAHVKKYDGGWVPLDTAEQRWRVAFRGEWTADLFGDLTAAQFQAALESLTSIGVGNVAVERTGDPLTARYYYVTFQGTLAHTNVALLEYRHFAFPQVTAITYGGEAGEDESQQIALEVASGGTWTITFDGQTTAGLAPTATAEGVQSALAALANIGSGNVAVTKEVSDQVATYTITFQGDLGTQDVSEITVDTSSLTGGPVYVTVLQQSAAQQDEIQRITVSPAEGETTILPNMSFVLAISTDATTPLAYNASAATMEAALEALASIGAGNVAVTGGGDDLVWTITFQGGKAHTNMAMLVAYTPGVLTFTGGATGGTFTLTYGGYTTNGIAIDATAATIESELAALTSIGSGNVTVDGIAGGPWYIFFAGTLASANVLGITGTATLLTGPGSQFIDLVEVHPTGPNWFTDPHNWADDACPEDGDTLVYEAGDISCLYGIDAYLLVTLTGNPDGGGWSMTYKGYGPSTGAGLADAVLTQDEIAPVPANIQLPYNATAAQVQTYLEAIPCLGAGSVTVTGDDGGPYTLLFHGPATTDSGVLLLEVDGTELLVGTDPDVADVTVAKAALQPAGLRKKQNYSGDIGLPPHTGDYVEYRPQRLRIGGTGDTLPVDLGEGDGTGSGLVRLDTAAANATLTVYNTGSQSADAVPAVEWIGTGTNTVIIYRGSFGAAIFEDDVSSIATLTIGYQESRDSDATVTIGRGVTLGNVVKTGGTAYLAGRSGSAITSIVHSGGTLIIDGTDAVSQLTLRGGTVYYNTSGTLGGNTIVSGASTLDFSRDLRAKTVTNPIEVFGTQHLIRDPENVVTSLIVDGNHCRPNVEMGENVRITRGATA